MKNKSMLKPIYRCFAFIFLLLLSASMYAQKSKITGYIEDVNGTPLPGVSIVLQGTTQGTQTDFDGNFSIDAEIADKLLVSYIGLKPQTITLSSFDALTIIMQEDAANLDEVVVIGYGSRRKGDLIGSVATIDPEKLNKVATSDIGEMIRGQVAGVQVTLNDGGPGSTSNILIRGQNSVNGGNAPLVIVDGVPVGAINDVNPNDIESLNILKDAASLAIYGARASNGVILITTKRGKVGKATISYSGATGLQTINRNFDIYSGSEFAQLKREADRTSNLGVIRDDEDIFSALQLASINSGEFIDWEDLIISTGITHNHNLSISTGTENTSIFTSLNVFNQEGVVDGTLFNRVTGRVNVDQRINDWFKAGVNLSLQYSRETGPDVGDILLRAITTSPLGEVFNEDGTLRVEPGGFEENKNPLVDLQEVTRIRRNRNDILNVFFDIKPFKGLNYRLNLSRRSANIENRDFASSQSIVGLANESQGQAGLQIIDNVEWQWENIVSFNTNFGTEDHSFDLTGVHSLTKSRSSRFELDINDLPNDILGVNGLASAASTIPSIEGNIRTLLSGALRAEYSYKSKYFIQASARADASSIFGTNNRWGFYPSVGASWNAHNEDFLRDVDAINNLKFSVGYGQVGNQTTGFDSNGNPFATPAIATADQLEFVFDGERASGFAPGSVLSNPDLKWETTTTLNAKVDFSLYNRINSTVEFYNSRTTDLFFNRSLPASTGFDSQLVNLGEVENQGIEITFDADIIRKKDFNLNLGVSFTRNTNKIISLFGDLDGDGIEDDDLPNTLFIGRPIDTFFQFDAIGIFQEGENIIGSAQPTAQPGDIKVRDANGDGVINQDDRVITEAGPEWFGSAFLNITYKNLDFSANLNTVQGVTRFNDFLSGFNEGGSLRGIKNGIKQDFWTPENPTGNFPRPNQANDPAFLLANSLQDASFIRLQNVSLGYSLPEDLLSSFGLSKLRLYVTGSNLFTITDFESFSPERDPNEYPEAVTIVVGLQLGL